MGRECSVLVLAASAGEWLAFRDLLTRRFEYRVFSTSSVRDAASVLESAHVDLVVAEDTPTLDGCGFLAGLRTSHPDVMRIAFLDEASTRAAEVVSRAALYQFLRAPLDAEQACLVVQRTLEARELSRRHRRLSRVFKIADGAGAPAALPLRALGPGGEKRVDGSETVAERCGLARAAAADLPVLVEGEGGAGKERLARAIHFHSKRSAGPLLVQSCGGVPDRRLQSELFGHKRGAFEGATEDHPGLFAAADGGTILLDEIAEASPSLQAGLLRFLQEGAITPLGSDQATTPDVRVIAASSRPLSERVAAGAFRRDLYERLRGFEFVLPPRRDRPDEAPALAEVFAAERGEAAGRTPAGPSAGAVARLAGPPWSGDLRELEAEILCVADPARGGGCLTQRPLSPECLTSPPRPARLAAPSKTLKELVESLERQAICDALSRHRWNQSRAAGELGLSRVGLANKIKRYGLEKQNAS